MSARAPSAVLSMTGFGHAHREGGGIAVRAEARSVNARHFKLSVRAPSALDAQQQALEALVRERIDRGTVTLTVHLDRSGAAAAATIDEDLLADYARKLRRAAQRLHAPGGPTMDALLRLPGVVRDGADPGIEDDQIALILETVACALDDLVAMRRCEGGSLAAALSAQLDEAERQTGAIEARAPDAVAEQMDRLRLRLAALLDGTAGVAEELVARETALLADRADVAEEVERLRSHVAQWRNALDTPGAKGRRLEFLSQEMGREVNTIGAKSNDTAIRAAVVELKLAVDRLKEQAANVE